MAFINFNSYSNFPRMKYLFIIAIVSLITACGVKQPVDSTQTTDTGSIYVTSQPDSALIFLDGQNTFRLTPDTLTNIPVGNHFLKVQRDGYESLQDSIPVQVTSDSTATISFQLKKLVYIGLLAVTSDPPGAEIFVNGESSGMFTPDTLQLAPGSYDVRLEKNGFVAYRQTAQVENDATTELQTDLEIQQRVLFESFGNVSCMPCVESAENLERFRSEHTRPNYVLFEYYANWPSPNDPFYLESPQDVDKRVRYYSIYTLPSLRLNGQTGVDASKYDQIESAYNTAVAQQNTPLAISLTRRLDQDTLRVSVEIYDYDQVLNDDQLRLFVFIYEDDIHFDSPPGSNGLKDFNFVFRKFLTDREGDPITGTEFNYKIKWQDWEFSNSHVVAFIQNISTQKVLQTTIN